MKSKITKIVRILYGLFFAIMGFNFFFHFINLPPMPLEASNFMMALGATGYMLPLIGGVQALTGLMLVFNIFTSLALILLAPVVVNILLFHMYLDPTMLGLAVTVTVVHIFLAVMYWDCYSHLFCKRK